MLYIDKYRNDTRYGKNLVFVDHMKIHMNANYLYFVIISDIFTVLIFSPQNSKTSWITLKDCIVIKHDDYSIA